eukprot:g7613.t3
MSVVRTNRVDARDTASEILEQASLEKVGKERMKKTVLLTDDFRDTALHLSACQGEVGIVKLLLARGAEVDSENNLGSTPLNRAAVAGKTEATPPSVGRGGHICSRGSREAPR